MAQIAKLKKTAFVVVVTMAHSDLEVIKVWDSSYGA